MTILQLKMIQLMPIKWSEFDASHLVFIAWRIRQIVVAIIHVRTALSPR